MDIFTILVISLVKILIVVTVILLMVSYLVYFERKISAWIQNRVGPNRVRLEGSTPTFCGCI